MQKLFQKGLIFKALHIYRVFTLAETYFLLFFEQQHYRGLEMYGFVPRVTRYHCIAMVPLEKTVWISVSTITRIV